LTAEFFDTTERRFRAPRPGRLALVLSVMLLVVVVVGVMGVMGAVAASAQDLPDSTSPFWGHTHTPADTLGAFEGSLWGPVPARHDSVSARYTNYSRPAWETAVMVPYWVIGIPFRLVYYGVDQSIVGMDKLGFFGEAASTRA
jgi:hypothetical protein